MNELLPKYVTAAKAIIYDAKRASTLVQMLATKSGTVSAVHSVMAALGQAKKIPPNIAPELALTIFALLLDIAHQITGRMPSPKLVGEVAVALRSDVVKHNTQTPAPQNNQQPMQSLQQPSAGLINQGA